MEALGVYSSAGELALVVLILESQTLTGSATTQAQIQGFVLAYPKIYIICELLGSVQGSVLVILSCRISMTQDSKKITGRSPL